MLSISTWSAFFKVTSRQEIEFNTHPCVSPCRRRTICWLVWGSLSPTTAAMSAKDGRSGFGGEEGFTTRSTDGATRALPPLPDRTAFTGAFLGALMLTIAVSDFRYVIPNELTAAAAALALLRAGWAGGELGGGAMGQERAPWRSALPP